MKICICICTYNRYASLQRVLEQLKQVELEGELQNVTAEFLIIDNQASARVEELCLNFSRNFHAPLQYVAEPKRGISQARNRAVQEALVKEADYIAFIDDDDLPRPDWLAALLVQQRISGADIVFGCWVPAKETPDWVLRSNIFKSLSHGAADQKQGRYGLPWMASTCNVLIGRDVLIKIGEKSAVFSLALSHSGGEDKDFFIRALADGFSMASAEDSIVTRHYESKRYSANGLFWRGFKSGCSRMQMIRTHRGDVEFRSQAKTSCSKLFKVCFSLPFCISNRGHLMHQIYRLGKAAGVIYFFLSGKNYMYYSRDG